MLELKKLKTIRSHAGLARWLAEVDGDANDDPVGYIARKQRAHIPSPWHYSPVTDLWSWNGQKVFWSETSHRHYEVYGVPADATTFPTDDAAMEFEFAEAA